MYVLDVALSLQSTLTLVFYRASTAGLVSEARSVQREPNRVRAPIQRARTFALELAPPCPRYKREKVAARNAWRVREGEIRLRACLDLHCALSRSVYATMRLSFVVVQIGFVVVVVIVGAWTRRDSFCTTEWCLDGLCARPPYADVSVLVDPGGRWFGLPSDMEGLPFHFPPSGFTRECSYYAQLGSQFLYLRCQRRLTFPGFVPLGCIRTLFFGGNIGAPFGVSHQGYWRRHGPHDWQGLGSPCGVARSMLADCFTSPGWYSTPLPGLDA